MALQTAVPKLFPVQDVHTRWNSTFLMLDCARKLQWVFDQYCHGVRAFTNNARCL
ncbi:uncharacterized protein EURHEDRAFT_410840 [Aspergillus ruber CBS 135680]|uniref:Uncharacterized protein n=1 Tax=Aspergillus ruber (strain CBS 135680) TaxID=1388766 RepID=A0A017SH83_ASPRC|nr:uncharacterized protein EURHEDRAFT_410840 [Aspergillus ruber CBS 135680]EYE96332.1 hypothetical protein EURHEDRAFT_410840 [Aspergillus ruber CBS 135680]